MDIFRVFTATTVKNKVLMIIFDLETLADCEHRRHFVDSRKAYDTGNYFYDGYYEDCPIYLRHNVTKEKWKPDWKAFYEACDKDLPIEPVVRMIKSVFGWDYYDKQEDVHIWSGRCESVRKKTEDWLDKHNIAFIRDNLKMRPIGDSTPDDELEERWLDDAIADVLKPIMVFDDRPKVIRMWQRRGVFVFNCCQHENEF